jgi:hypothetical protein
MNERFCSMSDIKKFNKWIDEARPEELEYPYLLWAE